MSITWTVTVCPGCRFCGSSTVSASVPVRHLPGLWRSVQAAGSAAAPQWAPPCRSDTYLDCDSLSRLQVLWQLHGESLRAGHTLTWTVTVCPGCRFCGSSTVSASVPVTHLPGLWRSVQAAGSVAAPRWEPPCRSHTYLDCDGLSRLQVLWQLHGERLRAGQTETGRRVSVQELKWHDAHPDQVAAVDPLIALRDHSPHTLATFTWKDHDQS